MILKNSYVRATFVVLLLTIMAGVAQANIHGPLWLFAFSGVYLGAFLVLILFFMSVISIIRESRKPTLIPTQNMGVKVSAQPGSSSYYRNRFLWSLILAVPGALLWLSAAFTTRNGGGEAYIVFIPLFMLSFAMVFLALFYGIAYLLKRGK